MHSVPHLREWHRSRKTTAIRMDTYGVGAEVVSRIVSVMNQNAKVMNPW